MRLVIAEAAQMHTELRHLTEDLAKLERHTNKLVTTAKSINGELIIFNKKFEEQPYIDSLIEGLENDGEKLKYSFCPLVTAPLPGIGTP